MAASMAEKLFDAMRAKPAEVGGANLARIDPLSWKGGVENVSFSGGVSEYIYGREATSYGDLGPLLAEEIKKKVEGWRGVGLAEPAAGIRATVIGASQYTIQLSGSTIFVSPMDALPMRNISVIAPELPLDDEKIDRDAVSRAVSTMLKRLDLASGDVPVAVFVPWRGSATFHRLDDLCRGIADGLSPVLAQGHPMVLAGDSDIGGLIGIHCKEELKLKNPVVSIDGLELKEFDFIDIGAILSSSGAAPVVIKSLIFPNSAAIGKVTA
jgi:ethanolamine utilization protein EutA